MGTGGLPRYQPLPAASACDGRDGRDGRDGPAAPAPQRAESLLSRAFTALAAAALVATLVMASVMPSPSLSPGLQAAPLPPASVASPVSETHAVALAPAHNSAAAPWVASAAPLEPEWEWARNATIVFTWVNGSDPRNRRLREMHGGPFAVGGDRDRDNDDLKYSLRTLARHLPWHTGRIVVVSPSPPSFVRLAHPPVDARGNLFPHASPSAQTGQADLAGRVEWIDQDVLIPERGQPTFSSNVVEAFLHKLPPPPAGSHLSDSEWIIHCNDDYTFPSYLHPSDFFTLGGGPRVLPGVVWNNKGYRGRGSGPGVLQFLERGPVRRPSNLHELEPTQNIWLFSTFHTLSAIESAYGPADRLPFPPHFVKHAPFVYTRTALQGTAIKFEHEINRTLTHRFRHHEDIITPLLVQAYTALEGSLPKGLLPLGKDNHPLTFAVVPTDVITPGTLLQKWTSDEQDNFNVMRTVRQYVAHGLKFLALNDEIGIGFKADRASLRLKQFYRDLYGDEKSPLEL